MVSIGGLEGWFGVTGDDVREVLGRAPDVVWASPLVSSCFVCGDAWGKGEFHVVVSEEI